MSKTLHVTNEYNLVSLDTYTLSPNLFLTSPSPAPLFFYLETKMFFLLHLVVQTQPLGFPLAVPGVQAGSDRVAESAGF